MAKNSQLHLPGKPQTPVMKEPSRGTVRPGGRTERVRESVANTVLLLIGQGKIDFSYNDVAELSGVHKTTLYRRWPQRADLMREAVGQHNTSYRIARRDNWNDTAELMIKNLAKVLSCRHEISMNCAFLADASSESNKLIMEYWKPVHDELIDLFEDIQQQGDIPADIDPEALLLAMLAPLLVITVTTKAPVPKKQVSQLIKIFQMLGNQKK